LQFQRQQFGLRQLTFHCQIINPNRARVARLFPLGQRLGLNLQGQNLAQLDGELNRVAMDCAAMTPTVTVQDVTNTTTIIGNGTFNVINMHKLNLDHNDQLILSGNSTEVFIINIADGLTMTGTAKVITAGNARSSHVLINVIGKKTAASTITNTINATVIVNDGSAQLGNVNGQILVGGSQLMTADNGVYNFIPFGS